MSLIMVRQMQKETSGIDDIVLFLSLLLQREKKKL